MKFSPVATLITTSIVGAAIIASVIYHYQRETTSIEDKYLNRPGAEIDATYYQSYLDSSLITEDDYYSDNLVEDSEVYGSRLSLHASADDDWDGDGWPNDKENEEGTEPDNPDTDGDGIVDSQDTDPTNPEIGGTAPPPPQPPRPPADTGRLIIKEFYKNTRNIGRGETRWTHYTTASPGDTMAFLIYINLENSSSSTKTATLYDFMSHHLSYAGHAILNGSSSSLAGESWLNGLDLSISGNTTKEFEISFWATARDTGIASNTARLVTPRTSGTDTAFVNITSPATPIPPPPASPGDGEILIHDLAKYVRNLTEEETAWANSTTAQPGDELAFEIFAKLENTGSNPGQATLDDILREDLEYNTTEGATISRDDGPPQSIVGGKEWLNGYLLTIESGIHTLEIIFQATLLSDTTGIGFTKNTARLVTADDLAINSALVNIAQ